MKQSVRAARRHLADPRMAVTQATGKRLSARQLISAEKCEGFCLFLHRLVGPIHFNDDSPSWYVRRIETMSYEK